MSGHSKWATIRHKKGALDAKRGKVFSKIIKEITVSTRIGGPDPEANPRLRTSLIKARAANMPKDNIDRAIKKGSGADDGLEFLELQYEAYAPGGVGIIVDTMTDNKNRTASEVRSILNKGGASLATTGAVAYQFRRAGVITYDPEKIDFDKLLELALDLGVDDISSAGELYTSVQDFEAVLDSLESHDFHHLSAEVTMISDTKISLDQAAATKVLKLVENLEDCDDVQNVATNLELSADYQFEE